MMKILLFTYLKNEIRGPKLTSGRAQGYGC
uniref:Uncharacterized protein n=1 Tax=Arundo donax TaxID=35708 RepID=A0A0A8YKF7_ARUDO